MKEYSAYLTFSEIDQDVLMQVKALAENAALQIDVGKNFLEFEYFGRDTARQVIQFLFELARLLHNASGEAKCELVNDDGDSNFEFYRISDGKLICQLGKIHRGPEMVLKDNDTHPSENSDAAASTSPSRG